MFLSGSLRRSGCRCKSKRGDDCSPNHGRPSVSGCLRTGGWGGRFLKNTTAPAIFARTPRGRKSPKVVDEQAGGATTVVQTTGLQSGSGSLPWKAARSLRTFHPYPLGMARDRYHGPGGFPRKGPGLTSQVRRRFWQSMLWQSILWPRWLSPQNLRSGCRCKSRRGGDCSLNHGCPSGSGSLRTLGWGGRFLKNTTAPAIFALSLPWNPGAAPTQSPDDQFRPPCRVRKQTVVRCLSGRAAGRRQSGCESTRQEDGLPATDCWTRRPSPGARRYLRTAWPRRITVWSNPLYRAGYCTRHGGLPTALTF